jgi:hypothetical protein
MGPLEASISNKSVIKYLKTCTDRRNRKIIKSDSLSKKVIIKLYLSLEKTETKSGRQNAGIGRRLMDRLESKTEDKNLRFFSLFAAHYKFIGNYNMFLFLNQKWSINQLI